jgi:hypothetical protein
MPALERALTAKGYEVVSGEQVESFLRTNRVRYLDSLPTRQAAELLSSLDGDAVLVGSILTYERRALDPHVSLSLSLVDAAGEVRWSNVVGLRASESRGAFDLAKTNQVEVIARRVVDRILEDVPRERLGRSHGRGRSSWGRAPRVFRVRELARQDLTICVLPLENMSGARDAGRAVEAALQHRIAKHPRLTAVLAADLRHSVVEAGLRAPSRLTPDQMKQLAAAAGTPYFLLGTIFAYGQTQADASEGPEVELYLRLVDASSGRTVWSGLHRRTGANYEKLLRLGAVRDPATLAAYTAGELLDAFMRP